VIAHQADAAIAGRRLRRQPFQHLRRLRPAIDIVAQENLDAFPRRGIGKLGGYARMERAKEIEAAMNVADGIDPKAVGQFLNQNPFSASER
jgi:hypothetical protein